ncbi:hypothetical protein ACFL0V_06625, partial [Nanoarchaeota archaeon]
LQLLNEVKHMWHPLRVIVGWQKGAKRIEAIIKGRVVHDMPNYERGFDEKTGKQIYNARTNYNYQPPKGHVCVVDHPYEVGVLAQVKGDTTVLARMNIDPAKNTAMKEGKFALKFKFDHAIVEPPVFLKKDKRFAEVELDNPGVVVYKKGDDGIYYYSVVDLKHSKMGRGGEGRENPDNPRSDLVNQGLNHSGQEIVFDTKHKKEQYVIVPVFDPKVFGHGGAIKLVKEETEPELHKKPSAIPKAKAKKPDTQAHLEQFNKKWAKKKKKVDSYFKKPSPIPEAKGKSPDQAVEEFFKKEPDLEFWKEVLGNKAVRMINRVEETEARILANDLVYEAAGKALDVLEKIFGEDSPYSERLDELKLRHDVKERADLIKKMVRLPKGMYDKVMGQSLGDFVNVYRSPILRNILLSTGKLGIKEWDELDKITEQSKQDLNLALRAGKSEQVIEAANKLIAILEREMDFLKENIQRLRKEIYDPTSVARTVLHELVHQVQNKSILYQNLSLSNRGAYGEAEAHTIDQLAGTFGAEFKFTNEALREQIQKLRSRISAKAPHYGYKGMNAYSYLFGSLVLCYSIAVRSGNDKNRKLLLKAYKVDNNQDLWKLVDQAIGQMHNQEFAGIIRELYDESVAKLADKKKDNLELFESGREELWKVLENPQTLGQTSTLLYRVRPIAFKALDVIAHLDLLEISGEDVSAQKSSFVEEFKTRFTEFVQKNHKEDWEAIQQEEDLFEALVGLIDDEKNQFSVLAKRMQK